MTIDYDVKEYFKYVEKHGLSNVDKRSRTRKIKGEIYRLHGYYDGGQRFTALHIKLALKKKYPTKKIRMRYFNNSDEYGFYIK